MPWYSLIIVISGFIGLETAVLLAKREGQNTEHVWQVMVWIIIFGLIGARLWFILFPPQSVVENGLTAGWLLNHFFDLNQGAIAIWTGGLGMIGGMIGGVLGLLLYAQRHKLAIRPWLDIAAIALALAQTIGWWASAANQELYGPPTDLPWGVLITDKVQRVGIYADLIAYPLNSTRFHPLYLYESLWTGLIFLILLTLFVHQYQRFQAGDLVLLYLFLYSGGRFLLESLRVNVALVGNVNVTQAAFGVCAVIVGLILIGRFRRKS